MFRFCMGLREKIICAYRYAQIIFSRSPNKCKKLFTLFPKMDLRDFRVALRLFRYLEYLAFSGLANDCIAPSAAVQKKRTRSKVAIPA